MMPGLMSPERLAAALAVLIGAFSTCAFGQQPATGAAATSASTPVEPVDKRILGVLPNYRTVQDNGHVEPISV